ncbi:MAG TPA: cyclodeaminase/cyclohydrolase family protein [Burkholderiales bacterium]|nr:cyclodeaminase/cyclohydrolase family protein [Burkholderiales bacterium]
MIKDDSIQKFLTELAGSSSTPGGGSAAAVMGAMGGALVSMVCNLTIGKKNYAEVEAEMRELLAQSENLRHRLTGMINDDVEAFNQVMATYGMPKSSDQEKAIRAAAIQDALKHATQVPLNCAKVCFEVMQLSKRVAEKGNVNVVSDAGVAVLAACAGLKSAALNVYVNTAAIKDEAFNRQKLAELNKVLADADRFAGSIYELVKGKLISH